MNITIRSEEPGDIPSIAALAKVSDRDEKRPGPRHHEIIDGLRADEQLWLSLVAVNMDQAVIGHIGLAEVAMPDGARGWYAVAPVSVMPTRQSTGIGGALVNAAVTEARNAGARGLMVIGRPELSARFGCAPDPRLSVAKVEPERFQIFPFSGDVPTGVVVYPAAFGHATG
ncbi:GNAT family N-acetyltransferase [Qipengyuania sp. DSG2-2]|uniref:GNAT family N-acetyltransferase n=1 Tax=Qipengyuania sp. DGS2-2 TaxID=3349631 RepID=UPI0036D30E2C